MSAQAIILGAGPCGLAAAQDLSAAGQKVTVVEASATIGGLAKTLDWNDSRHDLGPHKLFTLDENLIEKVRAFLPPTEWLTHRKVSQIYMHGRFMGYPPSPVDLLKTFGLFNFLRCVVGMGSAQLQGLISSPIVHSFAEDARARVGDTFYELLFRPLAEKIWGDPTTLDERLSQSRIQVPSVQKAIAAFRSPKASKKWQADSYFYPRGGIGSLWTALRRNIESHGGTLLTADPVTKIRINDDKSVISVRTQSGKDMPLNPSTDWLISTIPLARLGDMIEPAIPTDIKTSIAQLQLNDLLLIFLKIDENVLGENAWVFVPDPDIIFHRVSTQKKFDPGMVQGTTDLICCEVMNYPGKSSAALTEEETIAQCVKGLIRMGLLKDAKAVKDRRCIRLPASYPVMKRGYQETLEKVLAYFDQFPNLRTVGRQGAYNYIGTLDAMDTGFGLARLFIGGEARKAWTSERQRTMFYPILD